MKFVVDKDKMLEAIKVLNLVPARPGILSSEFFQVTNKEVGKIRLALAAEIKGEYEIQGKGEWPFKKRFYIDRRVFSPFVLSAEGIRRDTPFVFSANEKTLIVRNGARKAEFTGQPPLKGYGFETDLAENITAKMELTAHAKFLIHCAQSCAGNDRVTPQLQCVYVHPRINGVRIYATNTKILYQARSKEKIKPPIPIPFPLFLVDLLESDLLKEVQWRDKYVCLIFRHGQIWQSVSEPAKTKFPAKVIDLAIRKAAEIPPAFTLPVRRFSESMSRLGMYLAAVRRQDWLLTISGIKGDDKIQLTSVVPQTVFKETLRIDSPLKSSISLEWSLDNVLPVFEFIKAHDRGQLIVRSIKKRSYVTTSDISLVIAERVE